MCIRVRLILVALCWTFSSARGAELGVVRTESGAVQDDKACRDDKVRVYRGIPYAASTAGANRWRPPQPVAPWDGVRSCDKFGPACPQLPYSKDSPYHREPEPSSEDCLYLNIWTAAGEQERLPVMVWIHGGGLTRGSGAVDVYDGTALTQKGVVVVTINYRLGPFGFFAHPALTDESPNHASGNYGFLDQIAALKWVQRNIAGFGGDPMNITIFGESAGSQSVNVLVASPLSKSLFHRAIGQSGTAFRNMPSLKAAEEQGLELSQSAGVSSLAQLRQVSPDKLIELASARGDGRSHANVDGWCLPEEPRAIYAQGKQNNVPTIMGSNADEMTTLAPAASRPKTLDALRVQLALSLGEPVEVNRLYPAANDADAVKVFLDVMGDATFTLPARMWARWNVQAGGKAYLYQFTRVASFAEAAGLGAFHAAEIAYVFNNLGRLKRPYDQTDQKLAEAMSTYWTNFARTGDPNGAGLPEWTPYSVDDEPAMNFGANVQLTNHVRQEKLDLLETLLQQRQQPAK